MYMVSSFLLSFVSLFSDSVLTREWGNSSKCSEVSANNPGRILQECQIEFNNVLRIDSGDV